MKHRIGIIGSTGYTGVVLIRLLLNHPEVEITYLSSGKYSDKYYFEAYPMFYDQLKIKCKPLEHKIIAKECDLIFLATPNDFAKEFVPKLLKENAKLKIIDLSADFRLESTLSLNKKKEPIKITYGLPEIYRNEIKYSNLIANPGCYPTSAILGLAPALKNKIINPDTIIIDSKSGISGAGKQPKQELHFCEVNESFSAYNLAGKHRHIPEIENEISKICSSKVSIVFSPHLLPINRGILSTIYVKLTDKNIKEDQIIQMYSDHYKNEPFVKVLPKG